MSQYAHILKLLAEGKQVEARIFGNPKVWQPLDEKSVLSEILHNTSPDCFREKQRTVWLEGCSIPQCETKAPPSNVLYYIPSLTNVEKYDAFHWSQDNSDKQFLQRGLVHLTKEAAIAHATTLITAGGGTV